MKMMKSLIVVAFCMFQVLCHSPVLISSEDFVKIIGYSQLTLSFKQIGNKTTNIGDQPFWISFNNLALHLYQYDVVLQSQFIADCPGKAQIHLTVESSSFIIYMNGIEISSLKGSNLQLEAPIELKCGVNNLTLVLSLKKEQQKVPGLVFSITQNQSHCYSCQTKSSFYNRKTCKCQCVSHCYSANHIWLDYPLCACPCTNQKQVNCTGNYYFDHKRCQCVCHRQYCVPGYRWNRKACQCIKKPVSIKSGAKRQ